MGRATVKATMILIGIVALAAAMSIGAAFRFTGDPASLHCSFCHASA
jgi:hypothetical protein